MSKPAESLRALLSDLIDYAGLFPPASLPMKQAVENYQRYLDGPFWWATGRLILPAPRLHEFETEFLASRANAWGASVLLGSKLDQELELTSALYARVSQTAIADCVEVKASSVAGIHELSRRIESYLAYYEVALDSNLPTALDAIKSVNGRVKIRTGGVTSDAFPSSAAVANFIIECAKRDLPFKATAGLHHPLRCVKPLTYEANAPTGTMHGFVNVFLGAVFATQSATAEQLPELLEDGDTANFRFDDDAAYWREHRFATEEIRRTREHFAISFGSCSFEEPIADLKALNLL